jgi:hypothetical protein
MYLAMRGSSLEPKLSLPISGPGNLAARRKRPCRCSPANKLDEFPSPHGFARAEGYIGYRKEYHIFGLRIVPFLTPKRAGSHVRFGSKAR